MRENLLSFLDDCLRHGLQTAFVHRRGLRASRWSYARLRTSAFQVARELEARNISKGERVLICAENSPEWVAAFFGCLLRGAIVVPLDFESSHDFASRVQQQVEAKLILYSSDVLHAFRESLPRLSLEELSDRLAIHSIKPHRALIDENDLAEIIFTSGTTAEPKGVCITHRNVLANINPLETEIQKYLKYERLVHPLRFLNLLPLSHVFGQFMGMFVPMLLGGETYFQDSLNPSEIIDTVEKNRISVVASVPRVLDTLRNKIERDYEARGESDALKKNLTRAESQHFLRRWWTFRRIHSQLGWKFWAFISGGAALPSDVEAFWRGMGFAVVQGYGMTETASLITVNHPFKLSRRSIGKSLPGRELKLDEDGEILVRGENVSPGYWGKTGTILNEEGVNAEGLNAEGWLRTGDVAQMDEEGNLFFKGRKKDVIVTAAGLNIYPDDLEAALNAQPEIRDSAVVGADTPQGPEPFAVLLLKDDRSDPAAIVKRANQTLSAYQQIRRWSIWPEEDFPRTPTQKIRKAVVMERLKAEEERIRGAEERRSRGAEERRGRGAEQPEISPLASAPLPLGSSASSPLSSSASFVLQQIARISGEAPARVYPSANLEMDLKLDSLGRVELLGALEDHYQVDIDEAAFTAATMVGEIEKMIRDGSRESAVQYEYPKWAQRFPVTWIRFLVFYVVILPLTRLMSRATVKGKALLRDVRGPVLFIANHITMVDAALILLALPARFQRKLAIAMEGEVLRGWRHPPVGTGWVRRLIMLAQYVLVVSLFNVFPLPQRSGFRRSFAFAGETMDRGYSVLVFPEGARTRDGEMQPFMKGIGLLAKNLDVPIVPAKIDGLYEVKKEARRFARRGQIRVTIGEPMDVSKDDETAKITKLLEQRVASL
jgi:long-chain acyl-CoA synthetase